MLLLPLALFISVTWNFEGGSVGRVETVSATHVRVGAQGEKDQDGRNRQANWYSFRVSGVNPGQPVTIDLIDLPGEYNYQANRGAVNGETPAVWSDDGKTWRHVEDFTYDPAEPKMTLRVTPRGRRFWVAHTPPYTNRNLETLWKHAASEFRREEIGRSVAGRPLWLWTTGTGPRTIWLMFRQHSWETGSSWVGEGAVRELVRNAELRRAYTWKILPMADPDGVARGGVRFNRFGFDLNRNWDVNGVAKMPEIAAQRKAILAAGGGALFLSLHNTETAEYLEGPPVTDPAVRALAERFHAALVARSSFAPTRPLSFAGPVAAGRMTVIHGLTRDRVWPAFLMEQRISLQPKYGRRPLVEDRLRFGGELVNVMSEVLQ
jgi:hypothetical protein